MLVDALAGAVLEGQGGDGARQAGCRQHRHAASPAAGDQVKFHSFPPKKRKGEPERAGSLPGGVQVLMPRVLDPQPLPDPRRNPERRGRLCAPRRRHHFRCA